jgi:hypothetical protein
MMTSQPMRGQVRVRRVSVFEEKDDLKIYK